MSMENIDIELEISKITLAGMTNASELQGSIETLVNHFTIESNAPTPMEVARELQQLTVDYMAGVVDDSNRDVRLNSILQKAMVACDPLPLVQSLPEAQ